MAVENAPRPRLTQPMNTLVFPRGRSSTRFIINLLTLAAGLLLAAGAQGHSGGTSGFATITSAGETMRFSITLPVSAVSPELSERMRLGQPGVAPDYQPLLDVVEEHIHISADGNGCIAAPGQLTPPADPTGNFLIIVYFVCAESAHQLTIRDDLSDALGKDYHTLAKIEWPGGVQQFAFQPDAREAQVTVAPTADPSSRGAGSFFLLGIQHILTGYDHLLFLLALLLRGGNVWSLLKIITAFTIAHSITLALAAFDVVVLPGRLVEATIALSIAYVAAEDLFMRGAASHRWAVSFVFGLVHGFGFSSVLRELGLPREGLIWSLLSFNLGVETGQAIAVLVAFPVLVWLHRTRWEARTIKALSAVVLLIGLGLFVDRAFFAN